MSQQTREDDLEDPQASEEGRPRWEWILASGIAVLWSAFQLVTSYFGVLPLMQQRPIHMAFGFVLIFLLFPTLRRSEGWGNRLGRAVDAVGIAVMVALTAYVAWNHIDIEWRAGDYYDYEIYFGVVIVLLVLEAARRTTGMALPIISVLFLLYAYFGNHLPDLFAHRGFSVYRIFSQLYLTAEGVYGLPMRISATLVFNFVLLGAFLKETGAGQFFIDLALSLFGRVRGGPAKVAVVASSFFGSISGSAVANVVGTGSFTIPLMKSIGYRPMFAGAVEAVASSGGQIMPPIMGAAAFLMAELLEISYFTVVVAALIPAILYYVAVFCAVDFEAGRDNLQGLAPERIPSFGTLMRTRWYFLIPPLTLVYLMGVQKYSPSMSAFWTLWTSVAVGMIRPETRMGPKKFWETLRGGALASLPIVAACATSGIILGVINLTGIGLRLSSIMVKLAGGEILILLDPDDDHLLDTGDGPAGDRGVFDPGHHRGSRPERDGRPPNRGSPVHPLFRRHLEHHPAFRAGGLRRCRNREIRSLPYGVPRLSARGARLYPSLHVRIFPVPHHAGSLAGDPVCGRAGRRRGRLPFRFVDGLFLDPLHHAGAPPPLGGSLGAHPTWMGDRSRRTGGRRARPPLAVDAAKFGVVDRRGETESVSPMTRCRRPLPTLSRETPAG